MLPHNCVLVIPVYNEGPVIAGVLQQLLIRGIRTVVVDDGSTDNSWSQICGLPVACARHPFNLGQGAALQTGTILALELGAAVIVHFDGDGQHSSDDIQRLIMPILEDGIDVVFGSRFLRLEDSLRIPRLKRRLLWCGCIMNALFTGVILSDAHNGLRALSRNAACQLVMEENGYSHASEILWKVRQLNLTYTEMPVSVSYSPYAVEKGQPMSNAIDIFFDICLRFCLP